MERGDHSACATPDAYTSISAVHKAPRQTPSVHDRLYPSLWIWSLMTSGFASNAPKLKSQSWTIVHSSPLTIITRHVTHNGIPNHLQPIRQQRKVENPVRFSFPRRNIWVGGKVRNKCKGEVKLIRRQENEFATDPSITLHIPRKLTEVLLSTLKW